MSQTETKLKNQLRSHLRDLPKNDIKECEKCRSLIALVDEAYHQLDHERGMLKHSIEVDAQIRSEAETGLRAICEQVIVDEGDGIFAFDLNFVCTVWNAGMVCMTGFNEATSIGQNIFKLLPGLSEQGDEQHLRDALRGKTVRGKESRYPVHQTGKEGIFESRFCPLRDKATQVVGGFAQMCNVTEHRKNDATQAEQVLRDPLTKLYNQRYFNQRLDQDIKRAMWQNKPVAILYCDLNNFASSFSANTGKYSRKSGDEVLLDVAEAIQKKTRGSDLVFRLVGGEFAVLLSVKHGGEAVKYAEKIRDEVSAVGERLELVLDLNIGVALYPEHANDAENLIIAARQALHIAKKRSDKVQLGITEYHLGDATVSAAFQVIKDIEKNEVWAYEAFARDAEGELSVYHLFQKFDTIGKLEQLKDICFQKQVHVASSSHLKRAFINVDFKLLNRIPVIPKPPNLEVILEISEQDMQDDLAQNMRVAEVWRRAGFEFAIDNFGAGFVSLPFIAQLNPAYVKLDRSTVSQAVQSPPFRIFLESMIVALKHYTKHGIIAEGIETEKELAIVKEMGICYAQGYLLGRPEAVSKI